MHGAIDSLLEGLTEPQRQTVCHVDGPLLVVAGPGSGKTAVVTRRIAALILQGIPPWQILALTFTNKAAGEMRRRVEALLPPAVLAKQGLTVGTFHSFGARLLRRLAPMVGRTAQFTIYDSDDQRSAMTQALREADVSDRTLSVPSLAAFISRAKNRLETAAEARATAREFREQLAIRAYAAYERVLATADAVDFDDLLMLVARLLQREQSVRDELRARYRYVLIDEYQDTNHAQFAIAQALAGEHRNLCVVGDPDQSIYGWRGADVRNILEFDEHFAGAGVISLGRSFRSTGHILAAADGLIRHNRHRRPRTLHTELGSGEKPVIRTCRDEYAEAQAVLDLIGARQREGVPLREIAVLYRVNALSRVIEEALRRSGIPYVVARGTAFYDRKEIRDALAYLRTALNASDGVALRRIVNEPPRGLGRATLDRAWAIGTEEGIAPLAALRRATERGGLPARAVASIRAFLAMVDRWSAALDRADQGLGEFVERVMRESTLESSLRASEVDEDRERLANVEELISAAHEFSPPAAESGEPLSLRQRLAAWLESIALVSDADAVDPERGAVTLLTLHAAKGLEFDTVAMIGLEEGLLPHARAATDEGEREEERRLCFVGMTRAKRALLLSRTRRRTHRGIPEIAIASSFLSEIPPGEVERVESGESDDDGFIGRGGRGASIRPDGAPLRTARAHPLVEAFPRGCVVRHPTFGLGRVEEVMARPSGVCAKIQFQQSGVKTLLLQYAHLTRLTDADFDAIDEAPPEP